MIPAQKSFGAFIAERYGTKWVYAQRRSERIACQYPDSAVITPKQQRELAADYRRQWGEEYNPAAWLALCALRAVVSTQCSAASLELCGKAIEALTTDRRDI